MINLFTDRIKLILSLFASGVRGWKREKTLYSERQNALERPMNFSKTNLVRATYSTETV